MLTHQKSRSWIRNARNTVEAKKDFVPWTHFEQKPSQGQHSIRVKRILILQSSTSRIYGYSRSLFTPPPISSTRRGAARSKQRIIHRLLGRGRIGRIGQDRAVRAIRRNSPGLVTVKLPYMELLAHHIQALPQPLPRRTRVGGVERLGHLVIATVLLRGVVAVLLPNRFRNKKRTRCTS